MSGWVCVLYDYLIFEDYTEYYAEFCSGQFGYYEGPHNLLPGDCSNPQPPSCVFLGASRSAGPTSAAADRYVVDQQLAANGLPAAQTKEPALANGAKLIGDPFLVNFDDPVHNRKVTAKIYIASPKPGCVTASGCEVAFDKDPPLCKDVTPIDEHCFELDLGAVRCPVLTSRS